MRRELRSYFATPVAYVFLVIFLVLAGILTFYAGDFYERGQADLQPFFVMHPWLYLILVPAIGYLLGVNSVLCFWVAYVITRPLGASFADYMDYSRHGAGLGLVRALVWGSLAAAMIILVSLLRLVERTQRLPLRVHQCEFRRKLS